MLNVKTSVELPLAEVKHRFIEARQVALVSPQVRPRGALAGESGATVIAGRVPFAEAAGGQEAWNDGQLVRGQPVDQEGVTGDGFGY